MQNTDWWYTWMGANQDIFGFIYNKGISQLYFLFPLLQEAADYKNIHLYCIAVIVITLSQYVYRKLNNYRYDAYYVRSQIAWLLSFLFGFLLMAGTTALLKDFAAFPRPFVSIRGVTLIYQSMAESKFYESFPSGHAAFAAFLVSIFWSRSVSSVRPFLALFFVAVCWYRVAIGAHFPADVVYGALVGFISVGLCRKFICKSMKVWK